MPLRALSPTWAAVLSIMSAPRTTPVQVSTPAAPTFQSELPVDVDDPLPSCEPADDIRTLLMESSSLMTSKPTERAHTAGGQVTEYSLCSLSVADTSLWFSKYRIRGYGRSAVRDPRIQQSDRDWGRAKARLTNISTTENRLFNAAR